MSENRRQRTKLVGYIDRAEKAAYYVAAPFLLVTIGLLFYSAETSFI